MDSIEIQQTSSGSDWIEQHPLPASEAQSSPSVRSWQGHLGMRFTRRSDKTILSRSQVQAPLKVQRPFYPEGDDVCHSVMLHTAGGIVGGDRLSLRIQLEAEAQALVTTAAATKVYRSSGLEAQQITQIQVAPRACLEWLPQETIVFDGACYQQQLKVELAPEATWLGWEITRLGRSARGERFSLGEWRSRTEIWQDDRLIWIDPQYIQGGSDALTSLHGLAGYPVIASFVVVGQQISDTLIEELRAIQVADPRFRALNPNQMGMTRLTTGLLCRYRGTSTVEVRWWCIAIWNLIRQHCFGRSSCIPRVWQL